MPAFEGELGVACFGGCGDADKVKNAEARSEEDAAEEEAVAFNEVKAAECNGQQQREKREDPDQPEEVGRSHLPSGDDREVAHVVIRDA
jgi:hypothetical protein